MSDGVHVYDYVVKHGSHNQAAHGKKGGGSAGGGAGGSAEESGGISNENLKEVKESENREWALEGGAQGKAEVKGIEDAAKQGNKTKIREIRDTNRGKAAAADSANDQAKNSMFSGVADYADDVLDAMDG
jgi:hypothetical protein